MKELAAVYYEVVSRQNPKRTRCMSTGRGSHADEAVNTHVVLRPSFEVLMVRRPNWSLVVWKTVQSRMCYISLGMNLSAEPSDSETEKILT